jgi:RAT1-interacting protein
MNRPYDDTLMPQAEKQRRDTSVVTPYVYKTPSHATSTVTLSYPCMEGFYSKNMLGTFHSDLRSLRYYYKNASFPMNLKIGFETIKIKDEEKIKEEKLNDILKWLKAKDQLNNKTFNFVCFRGLLTTLMVTPYEDREGWKISVVKYKDTIYLWQEDTEEKKKRLQNETQKDKEMCYYGRKFEQYMSTGIACFFLSSQ